MVGQGGIADDMPVHDLSSLPTHCHGICMGSQTDHMKLPLITMRRHSEMMAALTTLEARRNSVRADLVLSGLQLEDAERFAQRVALIDTNKLTHATLLRLLDQERQTTFSLRARIAVLQDEMVDLGLDRILLLSEIDLLKDSETDA